MGLKNSSEFKPVRKLLKAIHLIHIALLHQSQPQSQFHIQRGPIQGPNPVKKLSKDLFSTYKNTIPSQRKQWSANTIQYLTTMYSNIEAKVNEQETNQ